MVVVTDCSQVRKAGQGLLPLAAPRTRKGCWQMRTRVDAKSPSWSGHSVNSTLTPQSVPYDLMVIKAVEAQGWIWGCEGSVWLLQGATGEAGNAAAASGD